MLKAFKYRLNPSPSQSVLINKHIGSCRFVYNLALETKQRAYASNRINLTCFDLIKQLPELKKECDWLREINSQSLQQSIVNLDRAFTSFFKAQGQFPRFKNKLKGQSFQIPQNVTIENGRLIIPKFQSGIEIVLHRQLKGSIRQATISQTPTGKYFVSILCETGGEAVPKAAVSPDTAIGIDLGLKSFLVTSAGETIDNPRFLKQQTARLKFIQRRCSKHKGKRRKKKFARLHEKVANQRKDFLHKVSTRLIRENQTVAIEDLGVSNMMANHCLARSISDVAWGTFVTMLTYKADWYGCNIVQTGRFEPSSKTCCHCGRINHALTLADREWKCVCGEVLDRDICAAINIKNFALRNHLSVERRLKNRNELPTLVGVMTSEASIPLG